MSEVLEQEDALEEEGAGIDPSSILDLPDDQLADLDLSTYGQATTVTEAQATAEAEGAEGDGRAVEEDDGDEGDEGEALKPEAATVTTAAVQEPAAAAATKPEVVDANGKVQEVAPAEAAIDYEAAYKKLFAPFKANGKDLQVATVDEAVTLMQMGANYNKKMAALKPNLKLMKLLENNGLLSEEKLSFLIDLEKKNPDAIGKLLKDGGIDPLDLNAENASDYKPHTYNVDDRELELDTILGELQDSPSYNRTLDVVSNKWDGASKQVIAQQPQLLKVINDHISNGVYDLISTEIERERMFGRLNGLSDLEAYRHVGDAIQARGGFDHLASQGQAKPAVQPAVKPAPVVDDQKLKDKKRAASPTKATPATAPAADFNPLALSDDEFTKLVNKRLL